VPREESTTTSSIWKKKRIRSLADEDELSHLSEDRERKLNDQKLRSRFVYDLRVLEP
jgi:hypothetical protein